MRPNYGDDYIRILVSCDVDSYTGDPQDMETVLVTRFRRDVRRRADWTGFLDRSGIVAYEAEIVEQVRDLITEYGFNVNELV